MQNLIDWFLGHAPPLQKFSAKITVMPMTMVGEVDGGDAEDG